MYNVLMDRTIDRTMDGTMDGWMDGWMGIINNGLDRSMEDGYII